MKRKPILYHRITGQHKNRIKQVIGLIGVNHGAGVTHTALLLAFYLGEELGKKTAYIECNTHQDIRLLEEAYEWNCKEADTFFFHQITLFREAKPEQILEILNDDFECLILDFGIDFTTNREEFLRCGKKFIIGGAAPWNQKKTADFIERVRLIRGNENWVYLLPNADHKTLKRMKFNVHRKVYNIPYNPDPIVPSKYTCRLFEKLINEEKL